MRTKEIFLTSRLPFAIEKFLASKIGWYLFIDASK